MVAAQPLTDVSHWLRGSGLELVLSLTETVLLTRFARWLSERIMGRIDAAAQPSDSLVSSEAAKHRHALTGRELRTPAPSPTP